MKDYNSLGISLQKLGWPHPEALAVVQLFARGEASRYPEYPCTMVTGIHGTPWKLTAALDDQGRVCLATAEPQ